MLLNKIQIVKNVLLLVLQMPVRSATKPCGVDSRSQFTAFKDTILGTSCC